MALFRPDGNQRTFTVSTKLPLERQRGFCSATELTLATFEIGEQQQNASSRSSSNCLLTKYASAIPPLESKHEFEQTKFQMPEQSCDRRSCNLEYNNSLNSPKVRSFSGLMYGQVVHQMELVGVRVELPANTPMMMLKELEGSRRLLPILIGNPEAASIHAAIQGIHPPRPLTHDLLSAVIEALDHRVDRVTITEIRDHVFMAELSLVDGDGVSTALSCRPSDACALAIRTDAPIFASDQVLDTAGQEEAVTAEDEDEELLDEFQDFLQNVNPDDFLA